MSLSGLVWMNCENSLNHAAWAQGTYASTWRNQGSGSNGKDLVGQNDKKITVGVCYQTSSRNWL